MQLAIYRVHSVKDLSIEKTGIRTAFRSHRRSVDRKCRRPKLLRVPVSAGTMSDLPFDRRVSVDGGVQSITLIHGPSSLLPPMLLLYGRPLMPPFPSRITVVLSHHLSLEDRRTDERLSRARNAPFLFFTCTECREKGTKVTVLLSFPRGLARNKTAATKRIDACRCKFVPIFHGAGHSAAALASSCLTLPGYTAC